MIFQESLFGVVLMRIEMATTHVWRVLSFGKLKKPYVAHFEAMLGPFLCQTVYLRDRFEDVEGATRRGHQSDTNHWDMDQIPSSTESLSQSPRKVGVNL